MVDKAAHVMEETVMESKQSQFWNAVAAGVFIVVFGILIGYGALLIVTKLPDLILKGGVASTEELHFALAAITNPSAWLLLGFGLIMLVAVSRRLLLGLQWLGANKQTPVEQSN